MDLDHLLLLSTAITAQIDKIDTFRYFGSIHPSGEETLWQNGRTRPDSGLHCGIGSHCLTDSCRKNEEEEEEYLQVSQ